MKSDRPDVLIVGAGVSGLSTAVLLAEQGVRVRVRSEHSPSQTNSASAGAIWEPIYAVHPSVQEWAEQSYKTFVRMRDDGEAGVALVDGIEASRHAIPPPDWAKELPGYQECTSAELPDGFVAGWHYQAPIIDMPPYLERLAERLHDAGGELLTDRLATLDEGFADAPIVVNCSGFGARDLVPDPDVTPIRGHLVAVRNPGWTDFFAEHTDELSEMTYLLPQGDVLLLGGSAEEGEWEAVREPGVAAAILERCRAIFPEVRDAEVIECRVGIRPGRSRIRLGPDAADPRVVHNYGHGGAGVSLSWGCADEVAKIVINMLKAGEIVQDR